jgi:hypothetical protein
MVWSQYVYEATTGFDADASDDDELNDNTPLNIEDWEVEYSDELKMMWNTIRTLLYDAGWNTQDSLWILSNFVTTNIIPIMSMWYVTRPGTP